MTHVRFCRWKFRVPRSRAARLALGGALMVGGTIGFLPILGFWMLPLGLVVLSVDVPWMRRFIERIERRWCTRRGCRHDVAHSPEPAGHATDRAPRSATISKTPNTARTP